MIEILFPGSFLPVPVVRFVMPARQDHPLDPGRQRPVAGKDRVRTGYSLNHCVQAESHGVIMGIDRECHGRCSDVMLASE